MKIKYEMETMREIWNNQDGERIEVGPDRDGLSLIELRYRSPDGKIGPRITIHPDSADLIAQAIIACAKEIENL